MEKTPTVDEKICRVPLILHEDHVLFKQSLHDEKDDATTEVMIFIDTGSPGSASTNHRTFCFWPPGERGEDRSLVHSLGKHWLGNTVERISELVGTKIDILVGINLLSKYYFSFSYKNAWLNVSTKFPQPLPDQTFAEGDVVLLREVDSIPQITFTLPDDDTEHLAYIDTGAPISYITSKLAQRFESLGAKSKKKDFYPGFGHWETELRNISVTLGGWAPLDVKFGVLPNLLELGMLTGGVTAIIGSDLFRAYEEVGFDMQSFRLFLKNQIFPDTKEK